MYNYQVNNCGLVHITIGDGGNQEGLSGLNYLSSSNKADPLAHCAPPLLVSAEWTWCMSLLSLELYKALLSAKWRGP